MTATEKLTYLYSNEINCMVRSFWDGGWDWSLGDQYNGWKAMGNEATIEEAVEKLWAAAQQRYPKAFRVKSKKKGT